MLQGWVIIVCALGYLGILFAVASWGDRRADQGRSIINHPVVYVLSLAVYCTSWTFYGSVGRAASRGGEFLTIYLGPTLMAAFSWLVLRKIVRISKAQRITSIADFISARYGKSAALGGLVTVIATLGVIPYIALQLKAISASIAVLLHHPDPLLRAQAGDPALATDTAFYVALLLAAFTIIFGTRHTDATERHEGMVAALAFDSIVKLVAFLAVGIFVTFGMFGGFGDLTARAQALPQLGTMLTINGGEGWGSWTALTILSMLAILCLPRQFQLAVIENVDEQHLRRAVWLFPLYLLIINIFVLPIAIGGLLLFPAGVDPDTFVLTLPMAAGQQGLALVVFLGGLSAATGMVIVEAIALSTMLTNSLILPSLLRLGWSRGDEQRDLTGPLLFIRRGAIIAVLLLGYLYFRLAGEVYALVSIGLVSFAAVAQFAPAVLGGIFWKGGTRRGALCGMSAGFAIWAYTLLFPSFVQSGWWPRPFLDNGPLGLTFLKPQALFGLQGLEPNAHALFWSMLVNVGGYVGISLWGEQSAVERRQATLFVDIFRAPHADERPFSPRDPAPIRELQHLLARFLGAERATEALTGYARQRGFDTIGQMRGDRALTEWAETTLAGTVGAASARVMIASVVEEAEPGLDEVMHILDEASQVIAYSHQLEEKSRALEIATTDLRAANGRLQELDRLKDDFISTITHELRTPLTSIRAFSEILHENPALDEAQREHFLGIIIGESERLTRLINQVLDLAKLESGLADWRIVPLDPGAAIEEAVVAASGSVEEHNVRLRLALPERIPAVLADHDRLVQVLVNLISNAAKFCDRQEGRISIDLQAETETLRIAVRDNGPGVPEAQREAIFEKFRQGGTTLTDKPQGTGLGLPISRQIIIRLGGTIWVEGQPNEGAIFAFTLPLASPVKRVPAEELVLTSTTAGQD
jgi:Na+/proline symporter/nitrogen-specific signal transduction histidine kinase